uniref:Uncharacterized protein n=1 Tax=Tanacetum cinerariifolium TaxID=118510 RepID=A0A6L2LCQ3_TANCI|nr:hypothetical protein [Tanacetum cinerariifolium]
MEPFKSLMRLWVRNRSISVIWQEKVVTPLIEPVTKGFAAAPSVLKPKRLKVDKTRVYNWRTKKIIETMNVTFDELSTMAFDQNSSRPGLQNDIIDDNDEESLLSNSSSPPQNVSSLSNVVSGVLQNPPHESQHLNTYLSKTINLQTQHRDDHQKGLRSIGKALKDMMSGKW